jgi:hypothetical protein
MFLPPLRRLWKPRAPGEALLVLLLGGVAFLLACHDLQDNDVWWHLRAGEWILQNGGPPQSDPFTFASADRPWIDLHWVFQVVLFLTFRTGGVRAVILLAAALAAAAVLVALSARPRGAALPVVLLGWAPCLLLAATRFHVRPEAVTLLLLAAFLAVIVRLDEDPRLGWALPPLQVIWVNVHGLFVFGPIVLGFRLVEQLAGLLARRLRGLPAWTPEEGRWWRNVGGASAAVVLACLVNPYGLAGARTPLDLYEKVAEAGNPYKEYIEEFRTPREFVAAVSPEAAFNGGPFCCLPFLLLLLPVGFLLPALWRAGHGGKDEEGPLRPDADSSGSLSPVLGTGSGWLGLLAVSVFLLAAHALTLAPRGRPAWLVFAGGAAPPLFAAAGVAGGLVLFRRSWSAAVLSLAGGFALAAWIVWLKGHLVADRVTADGPSSPWSPSLLVATLGAAVAVPLLLWHGASLFRLLLAAAFAYLALNATNSLTRFGLVAGFLLSQDLALQVSLLLGAKPSSSFSPVQGTGSGSFSAGQGTASGDKVSKGRWRTPALVSLSLAGLLVGWAAAILAQRTGGWLAPYPLGLREQPLTFAHEAARFAGQEDMPRRALVYDLVQACVYVFHGAPGTRSSWTHAWKYLPWRPSAPTHSRRCCRAARPVRSRPWAPWATPLCCCPTTGTPTGRPPS